MSIFKPKTPEPVKALTPAAATREAEARLILAQNAADLAALEAQAKLDAEVRDANAVQVRATLVQTAKATKSQEWAKVVQLWTARFVPFLPLVLVNLLAVYGQQGWGRENLTQVGSGPNDPARWVIALLFAATLESIALFLAYYANRALNRGDSATALYLGAFGVAGIVAGVNYSHYASAEVFFLGPVPVGQPTAMSIVVALCSLASPWLWRIKHRDANRDRLHELGVIDTKAVKLSMARKVFYPVRSFQVTRMAVWAGVTNPAEAVENWEAVKAAKAARKAELKAAKVVKETKAVKGNKAPEAPSEPETTVERVDEAEAPAPAPVPAPALVAPPAVELPALAAKHPTAWEVLHRTTTAGNQISQRQLATNYLNKNRHHAVALITAYRQWKELNSHVNGPRNATP